MGAAAAVTVPVIVVHSERAMLPDLAHDFYQRVRGEKHELWLQSEGQIDFYDDARLIAASTDAMAKWFGTHALVAV
jgi:hypothetical protein